MGGGGELGPGKATIARTHVASAIHPSVSLIEQPTVSPADEMNSPQERAVQTMEFHPVISERLADLDRFSERHGKFRYCSCMRWRLTSAEFKRSSKGDRAAALAGLVSRGLPVGILAYADGEPVGWCSVAPRETYAALERYAGLPRLDDAPVWSVVCFFVDRCARGRGVTLGLLEAGVEYARSEGARIIEGYPVEPGPRLYTYMGSPATFRRAGFRDVTPKGQARLVMRYFVR
jgi:GNAT superfamily N-acetyltransferase